MRVLAIEDNPSNILGAMQANGIMEPVVTKAAKKLGIDQVELRKINAPAGNSIKTRSARHFL